MVRLHPGVTPNFAEAVAARAGGNHSVLESGAEDGIDEVEGQNRRRGVDSSGSECHVDHGRHEEDKNSLEGAHFEVLSILIQGRFPVVSRLAGLSSSDTVKRNRVAMGSRGSSKSVVVKSISS